MIIVLAFIFIASGISLFIVNNKNKYIEKKKIFFYSLALSLLNASFGFTGILETTRSGIAWFVALQACYLLSGILFSWLLHKGTFGELKNKTLSEALFITMNASLAATGFIFIFNYFSKSDLGYIYSASIIPILIPHLLRKTFYSLAAIPPEIYKVWTYPLSAESPNFDDVDTRKIYLMELEFSKAPADNATTNFKAKAPIEMPFGEWYRSFIMSYNDRFEQSQIQYINQTGSPHAWIFYTKPSFWKPKKFIDPDLTIKENKLNEKDTIVAKRIEVNLGSLNYN